MAPPSPLSSTAAAPLVTPLTTSAQPATLSSSASNVFTNAALTALVFDHLQEQLKETRAALEKMRRDVQSREQQSTQYLAEQLARLEQRMSDQHVEKLKLTEALDESSRRTLLYAGLFAGLAMLAMMLTSWFQLRATGRLTQFVLGLPTATRANIGHVSVQTSTIDPSRTPVPAETSKLIAALDRLEKRIQELESTTLQKRIQFLPEAAESTPSQPHSVPTSIPPSPAQAPTQAQAANVNSSPAPAFITPAPTAPVPTPTPAPASPPQLVPTVVEIKPAPPTPKPTEKAKSTAPVAPEKFPLTPATDRVADVPTPPSKESKPKESATSHSHDPAHTNGNGHSTPKEESQDPAPVREPKISLSAKQAQVDGILGKGNALLQLGQLENALACFDEAVEMDRSYPEAWLKKGSALEKLERLEEALECYNRAIALDQTSTLAYLYKGGVCNRLERFDEALACYELALKHQPDPRSSASSLPHPV